MRRCTKITGAFLVVLLFFAWNGISVEAAQNINLNANINQVQLHFANINSYQNEFLISDSGKANMSTIVTASNVDTIYIYAYLQQNKNGEWQTINTWNGSEKNTFYALEKNCYLEKGYYYRYVTEIYLYRDNNFLESSSYTSNLKWY